MAKPLRKPQVSAPDPPASERLDSWKEIAAYLKREVRTVQRWEKREGLPVYRHLHSERGTVYAYRSQLDAWWNNRRPRLQQEEQVRPMAAWRRLVLVLAAGTALVAALGVGLWWLQPPPLPFEQRDWLLIADFENRTTEQVLDGTLEYALERELSNSRFVNVVPRQRINDTLRLMKKPLDAPIDSSLGQEICLRDGAIRALLTGRVEKLDTTYVLSAALVDPTQGVTVAGFSEEATGQKQIVPALRRLSDRVRQSLGEKLTLIQEAQQTLARVTTPSLRALQLYSQADALIAQDNSAAAEELLKQAVEEDPQFASAFIHLAWTVFNQGRPPEDYRPYAQRSYQLAETTGERERYFILGSYHRMNGENEEAIAAYQALLRLYPDHFWGLNNLAHLLWVEGRQAEAVPYQVRRADMRPNDFFAVIEAAQALSANLSQARPYVERARNLASAEVVKQYPEETAWLELFPAWDYWSQGHVEEALREVNRVADSLHSRSGEEREVFAFYVALHYLPFGKLGAAEEIFQEIPKEAQWPRWPEAIACFLRDDPQALKDHFRRYDHTPQARYTFPIPAFLLIRAGLLPEAQKMISSLGETPGWKIHVNALAGELVLAQGQTEKAIPLLEQGLSEARNREMLHIFFFASESLARAWERQGDSEQALQVLEEASRARKEFGELWPLSETLSMRLQWQRAKLLRNMSREGEAQEIEAQLLQLLAYADPDHGILRALRNSRGVASTEPPE